MYKFIKQILWFLSLLLVINVCLFSLLKEANYYSNYEKIDGVSLLPLFNGSKFLEKYAYSETGNPQNQKAPTKEPNTHSIRTSNWKLIYNSYNRTKELYNLKL